MRMAVRRPTAGAALAAPAVGLMVVFFALPLLAAVYIALTSWNGVGLHAKFVGGANVLEAFRDPKVLQALEHNAMWIGVGTLAPLVLGGGIAVLLWSGVRGTPFYRTVFFAPFVLPSIVVAMVWGWIYDPVYGWLSRLLGDIGLTSLAKTDWLGGPHVTLFSVLGAGLPGATGLVVALLLAALQSVDRNLVDAAQVDGAGPLRRVIHVLMPQIAIPLVTIVTILVIQGFGVFDLVFIMTRGGPNDASNMLATYAFQNSFQLDQVGYGTLLCLLIVVLSLPCIAILNRIQRRLVHAGMGPRGY